MMSLPSDFHSGILGSFLFISAQGCNLDIKFPLKHRLMPKFSVMSDRTVNYKSLCGISAEVYYVILVVP